MQISENCFNFISSQTSLIRTAKGRTQVPALER